MWFDHALHEVLSVELPFTPEHADSIYDEVNAKLSTDDFRPRALFERFNIEVIATTESPLDDLRHHQKLRKSGWSGKVITAYRPDPVVDPEFEGFVENITRLGELTGENTTTWSGYLRGLMQRREFFRLQPTTATQAPSPPTWSVPNAKPCSQAR
jgi:glucuronate isomerase